jgi:hypothetical protein
MFRIKVRGTLAELPLELSKIENILTGLLVLVQPNAEPNFGSHDDGFSAVQSTPQNRPHPQR